MDKISILDYEISSNKITSTYELSPYLKGNSINSIHNFENLSSKYNDYFGIRYLKRIDRSVTFSLFSSEMILKRNKYLSSYKNNIGIMLGNNYANWNYVEKQMIGLYNNIPNSINPYVATAWFPAAAQGEISIRNKLHSISKTFSCDLISSYVALEFACDMLNSEKASYVLVGGYESLISPTIRDALESQKICNNNFPSSELACTFLVSTSMKHPNAPFHVSYLSRSNDLNSLLVKFKDKINNKNIDYCILPAMNFENKKNNQDLINEITLINIFFGKDIIYGAPSYLFGEIGGASFSAQLYLALWSLENQYVPYSYINNYVDTLKNDQNMQHNISKKIERIMIVSKDYSGNQYTLVMVSKGGLENTYVCNGA